MSGTGRGRGWLNLNKNNINTPQPGIFTPQNYDQYELQFEDEPYRLPPAEYMELIKRIRHLNLKDDGILFNQKIKHILEHWNQECTNQDDVERSFDATYEACLLDEDLASKLILMVSSRTFLTQEVSGQNIRSLFLSNLQTNVENGNQLQAKNPQRFRNNVVLLSEFYNKGRLANGDRFTFLTVPLISSLEMLLEKPTLQNLAVFTKQIWLNGLLLKKESPEKFVQLLKKTRTYIIGENLPKESKAWLLLTIEAANNNFVSISSDLIQYYEDILGNGALAALHSRPPTGLTIQTSSHVSPLSPTLDTLTSNVNVLQVSNELQNVEAVAESKSVPPSASNAMSKLAQKLGRTTAIGSHGSNGGGNGPSSGRPILGSGARLNKNEEQWNYKNGDDKNGGRHVKKHGFVDKKPSKGWQHDDRFENDYK